MIKVFISYSQYPESVKPIVKQLADQLLEGGVDTELDQYIHGNPANGWRRWMEDQIEQADYIICIFTESYKLRWDGKEKPGKGLGATRESIILDQILYESGHSRNKIIPVLLNTSDRTYIPSVLGDITYYVYEKDFDELYFYITKQPAVVKPPLGTIRSREPQNIPSSELALTTPAPIAAKTASFPQKVYISYHREDSRYYNMLYRSLQGMVKSGKIEIWSEDLLLPGDNSQQEKNKNSAEMDILIVLISIDSLNKDEIWQQEFQEARNRNLPVVPVLLRPVSLEDSPVKDLKVLPDNGKAVSLWEHIDEAMLNVVEGVRRVVG